MHTYTILDKEFLSLFENRMPHIDIFDLESGKEFTFFYSVSEDKLALANVKILNCSEDEDDMDIEISYFQSPQDDYPVVETVLAYYDHDTFKVLDDEIGKVIGVLDENNALTPFKLGKETIQSFNSVSNLNKTVKAINDALDNTVVEGNLDERAEKLRYLGSMMESGSYAYKDLSDIYHRLEQNLQN